jgi:hypothetical protein
MNMVPVSSSNIDSVGYDADSRVLRIRFNDGGTYDYQGVDPSTHNDLMNATSVGSYFHKWIKPYYSGTKL